METSEGQLKSVAMESSLSKDIQCIYTHLWILVLFLPLIWERVQRSQGVLVTRRNPCTRCCHGNYRHVLSFALETRIERSANPAAEWFVVDRVRRQQL